MRWIHAAKPTIFVETHGDLSRVTLIGDHGRIAARAIVPAREVRHVLNAAIDAFDFAAPDNSFALLTTVVDALEPPAPQTFLMMHKNDEPVIKVSGTNTPGSGGSTGGFPPWVALAAAQLQANVVILVEALHGVPETAGVDGLRAQFSA